MDRGLPSRMIDLIRDGVRPADLKASGSKAVWSALVRTAMSATQRGWTEGEWRAEILMPTSTLGRQVRVRNGKPRPARQVAATLGSAWDQAHKALAERPTAWTSEQVANTALRRALACEEQILNNPAFDFAPAPLDREILRYAIEQTRLRQTLRVPIPWRALAGDDERGYRPVHPRMTERRAKNGLARLTDRGLLVLEARGKAARDDAKRRANLYGLFPAEKVARLPVPGNPAYGTAVAKTYGIPLCPAPMGPPDEADERRSA